MSASRKPGRWAAAILVAATLLVAALAVVVARSAFPDLTDLPAPAAVSAMSAPSTSPSGPGALEDRTPEIRGRILDAEGNPVLEAAVRLVSPRPPYMVYGDVKTDAAGAFSFAHVEQTRVRVVADHDPGGVVSSAELVPLEGRSTDVVLVLSAAGIVRGTVVDPDDRPVASAMIAVEGAPSIVRRETSDEAGAFRLATVPLEATSLVVVARGYKTARVALDRHEESGELADLVVRVKLYAAGPVDGQVRDDDGNPAAARIVACEGQPAEAHTESSGDGSFVLPASAIGCDAVAERDDAGPSDPASVVEGRQVLLRLKPGGSIEGAVVDTRGAGVPKFSVGIESFSAARNRRPGAVGQRTFEDPSGTFLWEKLAPGSYVLTVSAPGKPPTRSGSIDVVAGVATRHVRILLSPGGTVMGHVYDEHHTPLGGVDLRFDMVSSVVDSSATATSDDTGQFRLEGAPDGPFTLRAQKDGFRLRMVSGLRVGTGGTLTQDVTLTAADGHGGMELGGIGASLLPTREGVALGAVFPGDPADRAGLRSDDRIVRIDGEGTEAMSVADVIQRLRGEAGTSVGVSVQRPGTGQTIDVVIVRGSIVR